MSLTRKEIKVGRCYRLVGRNGRSIIAKVERFVPYEFKIRRGNPIVLIITNTHFQWRAAGPKAKWSKHMEILSVEDFARHASNEVSCD